MEFLHTMVRATDIDASLRFYCQGLGLKEVKRVDNEEGKFTLVFLAAEKDMARFAPDPSGGKFPSGLPMIELTYNWPPHDEEVGYSEGRNFGHMAFRVDDIYATCQHLSDMGITINRPPRDGHMAFVRSPDNISIELLQTGENLPKQEPWASMENTGVW